jgi:UDP:flavonoid glycosyltransferase YjiC (YdhE family)
MRVLFVSNAARGHFTALLPLALALRTAGHEVRVAAPPALAPAVAGTGLCAVPAGEVVSLGPIRSQLDGQPRTVAELLDPERLAVTGGRFARLAEAMVGDLIDFGREWAPDLVVAEPTAPAGAVAAAALKVPYVRHRWGLDLAASAVIAAAGDELGRLARRFGVAAPAEPDVIIDPCPPALQDPAVPAGWRVRYVPFDGGAVLPDWLRTPPVRRRVAVTLGSMAGALGGLAVTRRVLGALAGLDVEVVVAALPGESEQLGPAPDVQVAEALPLRLLTRTCDLVVHHAGSNTMLTSLRDGLPQLVIPFMGDCVFNADRLVRCGPAIGLPPEADTADIAAACTSLLEQPAYRDAARGLRGQVEAAPPAAVVAERLVQLAK